MNNKNSMYIGIGWNALNSLFRVIIGMSSTFILSRMLTPSDFGTFGILLIFITVAELLSDSGMAGYIVKANKLDDKDYDTLFVYNFSTSLVLYVILYLSAPWIARFYSNESLVLGTRLCCTVVVFQSVSIIATAKLLRTLAFKQLTIISIVTSSIGLIIAIIWAHFIGGFLALVAQSVVSVLLNSAGQIWITKTTPRLRFDFGCFKKQFAFGINLMGSTIVQSLSSNISNNVIAKIFNFNLAGQLMQSTKLQNVSTSLIQGVIDRTFFPILSKISDDIELFITEARETSRMTYAICFPVFTIVIVLAKPIIYVMLGEQWIECAKIFQVLMVSAFPMVVKVVNRNILKALGHTRDIFLMELIPFFVLILCFAISVYMRSYMMFVVFMVINSFISSLMSVIYTSRHFKKKLIVVFSDAAIYSPFLIFSIVILCFQNQGIIDYLIDLLCLIFLISAYFIFGNQEYLKIKKRLHI